ncbi:MAG: putative peptide zinc metalloprotease protein [Solirubrobacteraceae bacterium]|nr:putative peptide zinc metalloprotease protein [Solirubrobacteraceae bacterium]
MGACGVSATPGAATELTDDSRLALVALTIVGEHDEFVVGEPATGRFFAVPPEGVRVLEGLRDGKTIREAASAASSAQESLDALDFARVLLGAGFVTEVDGQRVRAAGATDGVPEFNRIAGRIGRLLFSTRVAAASGALLVLVVAAFVAEPAMRPRFENLFIAPSPAVSFAVIFAMTMVSAMLHELCHWWATRSLGAPARIRLSRRFYIPVMETDISGLWGLPARLRYGPFLAGMVFDVLVLAVALALRLGWSYEVVDLPPTVVRILAALVTLKVFEIMFQFLVFLRTDLYAVMITALGARNLDRVTRLRLKVAFRVARPADRAELEAAHPRDLAASRWYAVCYGLGVLWAVWFFKAWFYPATFVVFTWMASTLGKAPLGSGYWWQAAIVAALVSIDVIWPVAVYLRQRAARRVGALS